MPRTCQTLTIAYVQGPDSRMTWPSAVPSIQTRTSRTATCRFIPNPDSREAASVHVGIDVVQLAVEGHARDLDLVRLRVLVAMAVHHHHGAERDCPFLQPGLLRP